MKNPKKECTCENCICKNVEADLDYLHEEILGLAEDIIDLDEEKEGFIDWANTCVDNYNNTLDDIDTNFSMLSKEIHEVDGGGQFLFWFLFVWNVILTALIVLLHYNVL